MMKIFQNTSATIAHLQQCNSYHQKTKIILLFCNNSTKEKIYKTILENFSKNGIYQVTILIPETTTGLQAIVHYPFDPSSESIHVINHPHSLLEYFPDKLKNLNGHQFTILSFSNPLSISGNTGTLTGVYSHLFNTFLDHINATYKA